MIEEKRCKYCNSILQPLESETKVSSKRKFCNRKCNGKFNYYKDVEKSRKYIREYMRKRYKEDPMHRERCKRYTYAYRKTEKGKEYLRRYKNLPTTKFRKKMYDQFPENVKKKRESTKKTYLKKKMKKISEQNKTLFDVQENILQALEP